MFALSGVRLACWLWPRRARVLNVVWVGALLAVCSLLQVGCVGIMGFTKVPHPLEPDGEKTIFLPIEVVNPLNPTDTGLFKFYEGYTMGFEREQQLNWEEALSLYEWAAKQKSLYIDSKDRADVERRIKVLRAKVASPQYHAWKRVRQEDSWSGYRTFLETCTDPELAVAAKRRLDELADLAAKAWAQAETTHTIEAYKTFLAKFPESVHAAEARRRIIDLRWAAVRKSDKPLAYRTFLSEFPTDDNPYSQQARERLAKLEEPVWKACIAEDTLNAYADYLEAYPQGRYATEARQRGKDMLRDIYTQGLVIKVVNGNITWPASEWSEFTPRTLDEAIFKELTFALEGLGVRCCREDSGVEPSGGRCRLIITITPGFAVLEGSYGSGIVTATLELMEGSRGTVWQQIAAGVGEVRPKTIHAIDSSEFPHSWEEPDIKAARREAYHSLLSMMRVSLIRLFSLFGR